MGDYQSKRPVLERDILVAKAKNDSEKVLALTNQLENLSKLSYNPFRPNSGETSWDVDVWYYEMKKRQRQGL
jgi:hypothetical protein